MRYARPVLRVAAERLSSWARWPCDRLRGFDGFVDELDDVEFVESDLGVGQAFRGAGDEGLAHVDAHLGDGLGSAAMDRQVLGEGIDRAGILALGDEQNAAADEIDE